MSQDVSLFSYKQGSSFLHKIPATWKIIFIPLINILFLSLPPYFAIILIVLQFIIATSLRFSFREQFCDVKPIIYYAFLLLAFKIISYFVVFFSNFEWGLSPLKSLWEYFKNWLGQCWGQTSTDFGNSGGQGGQPPIFTWESEKDTVFLLLKLFSIMQSASLIFKTSTALELRQGIGKIESFLRKIFHLKKENLLTDSLSMFLNFIPMVSKIWNQSKKAWLARGGKISIKMYKVLIPLLFSVGMKKAYNMARAISIRK